MSYDDEIEVKLVLIKLVIRTLQRVLYSRIQLS
jgi:hypothetical protein